MEELSIKVTIANRVYPLKIKRSEEERVRKAAKMLNDRIKEYGDQYAVNDKTDLISMCALQFATELVNLTDDLPESINQTSNAIAEIDALLNGVLKS